eukprot:CAMPEP_0204534036 /NCGR_PEP_ID=MMETSP0661-20131031/12644_1 /ASSEMBLY_ACC=CAM_ASM_000606 /TAXON_ID=109239 /ORGANISM="Alexandrium margalefi, Strain AMGDE01CS-322" /LENGTH=152 /DNA_ID=CAMNT_0051540465 /DNA_START=83 /DNA_END=541 /DNA_ORIENTATION=+
MAGNTNVFIADLPLEVDDAMLAQVFGGYGTVTWCKVLPNHGGKPNQAAIVEFADPAEARFVVENINGNIPQGLNTPVTAQFKRESKGKGFGKDGGGYGKAGGGMGGFSQGGKGKGSSPYEGGKSYGGGGGEVCRNFQKWGECKFGADCKFTH